MVASSDRLSLEGKVAIVTGAASGIGRASALLLAERGAKVVVADLTEHEGNKTAQLIGDPSIFVATDTSDEESVRDLVSTTCGAGAGPLGAEDPELRPISRLEAG
jgi:NAD(P)-dependent dehydrogenase (short-subunit alcohol dehydrogenase family)